MVWRPWCGLQTSPCLWTILPQNFPVWIIPNLLEVTRLPFAFIKETFVLGTGGKPGDAQVTHCSQPNLGKRPPPSLVEARDPPPKILEGTLVPGNLLHKPPVYLNSM